MQHKDVVLLALPWADLSYPSIQLGILKSLLDREGIECVTAHAFLDFAAWTLGDGDIPFDLDSYRMVSGQRHGGLGDALFLHPPLREDADEAWARYCSYRKDNGASTEDLENWNRLREKIPEFLDSYATSVLARTPKVVAFTTSFAQNVPSLVFSKILKQRDPSLKIVIGGANCEDEMGIAMHELAPWIDVVVRGQAENVAGTLFRNLIDGTDIDSQPGLCVRENGKATVFPGVPSSPKMDDVPTPNYDEYFETLDRTKIHDPVFTSIQITYETSRGCWWGAKHHCTFCGLNGGNMGYRSKSPERVFDEMTALARKYHTLNFNIVDNIMDMKYLRTVLPRLKDSHSNFSLFYETKANLGREQLRTMRDAGIHRIQPGIESLSSPILKLMNKGTTAMQNLRLLKWCAEFGIRVDWSLLTGFPGEDPEEYEKMAALIPLVRHLPAPQGVWPIEAHRFSPYFARPDHNGMVINGPKEYYRYLYDTDDATIAKLAYFFDNEFPVGYHEYVKPLSDAVKAWVDNQGGAVLSFRRGPGFVTITDRRRLGFETTANLEDECAVAFLALDGGGTTASVQKELKSAGYDIGAEELLEFLQELVDDGMVYQEGPRYLSLPIAEREQPPTAARAPAPLTEAKKPMMLPMAPG